MKTIDQSTHFLPYGRQHIDEADIQAVISVLQSDYLTQGAAIPAFEAALATYLGASHVSVCSNGTAALHLAMLTLGINEKDTVVTSAISFAASANCARYVGAQVAFTDIDAATGLMSLISLEQLFGKDTNHRIKAVIPVHFAGQPVNLKEMYALAKSHGAFVVDDACHALGATLNDTGKEIMIGANKYADITAFSFHPVKHIATGEGGALATGNPDLAKRIAMLRTHGIERGQFSNQKEAYDADGAANPWYYEMKALGFNYRMTDIQAALGISQLRKLDNSLARRRQLAEKYRMLIQQRFSSKSVKPLSLTRDGSHAWHLFVVQIDFAGFNKTRAQVMNQLRAENIGTQVHYIPIPMQPYYQQLGFISEQYPQAEAFYRQVLSLPMYPELTDDDVERVVDCLYHTLTSTAKK